MAIFRVPCINSRWFFSDWSLFAFLIALLMSIWHKIRAASVRCSLSSRAPCAWQQSREGSEWVLSFPRRWSEKISRWCGGIYPHPRARFNSMLQRVVILANESVRNWETPHSYVTWTEGVQLTILEPKGWCYKIQYTALLRFIFLNSFTCFDIFPNRLVLQKTCSTICSCC